ncbi:hypothetical protein JNUCC1_01210 [Lentibacillus sp. JNUCC-1]|uniref:GNAT family N-acetyltransferase n=1 Tax=Lentibacillus sp. JNUCC-1 TaxID=2654513 RepID=UPI0012E7BB54|nr:hypothetical protein [Lentibacillus sp. JNUCC-1]MUV37404.1 hypothetical protein [Lentibacillus sp. JNUCC-1]
MKIIRAEHVTDGTIDQLLTLNPDLDQQLLKTCGYVVDNDGLTAGCFALEQVKSDVYWLRQLQLTPEMAGSVIVLIETVINMAKEKGAQALYVHSHQPQVDTLLTALQFDETTVTPGDVQAPEQAGKWWIYHIS